MKSILCLSLLLSIILFAQDAAAQIPGLPTIKPKASPTPQKTEPASAAITAPVKGSDDYPKHFFFTTAAKAASDVLKAKDLVACISGENANPPNSNAFKKVMATVGGQKGRVIDAGTCDVVVLVIKDAEGERNLKRDNDGFAVYKIVGDDLHLLFKPESGQYLAVGKMELAGKATLEKAQTTACGHPDLRNSFRPNPDTWKSWANEYADAERMLRMTIDNYPLKYRCDVWIMAPELHKAFVGKFGNKHPVFDVNTTDPMLKLRIGPGDGPKTGGI